MASDQGLNCLLTGFSIKIGIKATKQIFDTPKMIKGHVQDITVEEFTSKQLVETARFILIC